MRHQKLKDLYFNAIRPLTYLNNLHWRARTGLALDRYRRAPDDELWVQLGSGTHAHPAFVNLEGNVFRDRDMWIDVRQGLPFPEDSVDAVYACHVFEHFYLDELRDVLAACRRVLAPGGGLRLLVPSMEEAVERYLKGDEAWFETTQTGVGSRGGKLWDFLFCDGQHRLAFDRSFANEILTEAGFEDVTERSPRRGEVLPEEVLADLEPEAAYIEKSLVVEARTPT